MTPEAHFRATAPRYMRLLMRDFDLSEEDAAAVFGNAGHESIGFTTLQEIKPTVEGSRGGYGWFQWTGPRRREFEAYCKRNKLDPTANDTNYGFLFVEMKGPEKRALRALKEAVSLDAKTVAFEEAFERSGVKAYSKRKKWAAIALDALRDSGEPVRPRTERPATPTPAEPETPSADAPTGLVALIIAIFKAIFGRKSS